MQNGMDNSQQSPPNFQSAPFENPAGVDTLDVNKLQILSCPVEVAEKKQSVQPPHQKGIESTSPNFFPDSTWSASVESLDARTPPNKEITSQLSDQLPPLSANNIYSSNNMNILNIENNANNVSILRFCYNFCLATRLHDFVEMKPINFKAF